ncbi:hypothetical protein [Nostoc sp. TCL26-01]|uniref:hypothetical protein n=1 Tax=Nostoc sp. TCL26-01 TaxID=2576904 RepID=UPI00356A4AE7
MSIEDYQRITRLNIQEFQQFRESIGRKAQECGLTEDKLNELLSNAIKTLSKEPIEE